MNKEFEKTIFSQGFKLEEKYKEEIKQCVQLIARSVKYIEETESSFTVTKESVLQFIYDIEYAKNSLHTNKQVMRVIMELYEWILIYQEEADIDAETSKAIKSKAIMDCTMGNYSPPAIKSMREENN